MTESIRYRRLDDGTRVKVVTNEGFEGYVARATLPCTGCHHTDEGYSTGQFQYDPKAKCEVGFGCHECGYTGKRRWSMWVPFNITAWSRHEREKERQAG